MFDRQIFLNYFKVTTFLISFLRIIFPPYIDPSIIHSTLLHVFWDLHRAHYGHVCCNFRRRHTWESVIKETNVTKYIYKTILYIKKVFYIVDLDSRYGDSSITQS